MMVFWRWCQKWLAQNQDKEVINYNRPSREPGKHFRWDRIHWSIPSLSAAPKSEVTILYDNPEIIAVIPPAIKEEQVIYDELRNRTVAI
ncbi:hypothetical protein J6D24_01715 [Candidatus Saccharibacteria bacterium]|nr:hypothetical protein [Candidatus Saccharibacteria bacterium]